MTANAPDTAAFAENLLRQAADPEQQPRPDHAAVLAAGFLLLAHALDELGTELAMAAP